MIKKNRWQQEVKQKDYVRKEYSDPPSAMNNCLIASLGRLAENVVKEEDLQPISIQKA